MPKSLSTIQYSVLLEVGQTHDYDYDGDDDVAIAGQSRASGVIAHVEVEESSTDTRDREVSEIYIHTYIHTFIPILTVKSKYIKSCTLCDQRLRIKSRKRGAS